MQQPTIARLSDPSEAHALVAVSAGRRAGKCVLVVDDERGVRLFVARALESAGYAVIGAGDGVEALELLEEHESDIDLVLTDIRMPRLDGLELGRQVAARQSPIPVAYMSADPPSDLICLQKPFSMTALLALVDGLTTKRWARQCAA